MIVRDSRYLTPDDILARDADNGFFTLMKAKADDEFKGEFIMLMQRAVMMSGYKYGPVMDKGPSHYEMLSSLEKDAYSRDDNAEHLVNIANYAMFRYMTDDHRPEYIDEAVAAMKKWDAASHRGTDSDHSVNNTEPSSV